MSRVPLRSSIWPSFEGEIQVLMFLHGWAERNHFIWLITEDILPEYKS